MLSIGVLGSGKDRYYLNLAREDYYLKGGEPKGQWRKSRGAEVLGLKGEVKDESFRNVYRGYTPEGKYQLVESAGRKKHRPGWDFTLSAPKSVSILFGGSGQRWIREAVLASHREAVEKTLSYLEENAVVGRGKGGRLKEPASLLVAMFEHRTSRLADPQLHTHCLVMNAGVTQKGETRALEPVGLFVRKMAAGAIYRAELGCQLQERLGVELVRKQSWFEVKGVPQSLIDAFSQRRQEILEALKKRGMADEKGQVFNAKVAAVETLKTRGEKKRQEHRSGQQLFGEWEAVCREQGFEAAVLIDRERGLGDGERGRRGDGEQEKNQKVRHAVERATRWDLYDREQTSLLSRQSYFADYHLIRAVAEELQTTTVGADAILAGIKADLSSETALELERLVWRGRKFVPETVYTTQEMLAVEKHLLAEIDLMEDCQSHLVRPVTIERELAAARERGTPLTSEQEGALRHMTQNLGRIALVAGRAGAGKSFTLGVARATWEGEGYQTIGCAVAAKAARNLKSSGFATTLSVEALLYRLDQGRLTLGCRSILVADEAGMLGTRHAVRLVEVCQQVGAKLVLVGDWDQVQAVEAGNPFKHLAGRLGYAELSYNWRQAAHPWAQQATAEFSRGQARKALARYSERGFVTVASSRTQAMNKLVRDWRERGGMESPEHHLMIAGTNQETVLLNRKAQSERLRNCPQVIEGGCVATSGGERFYPGDRVLFAKNSRRYGVENGSLGTIERLQPLKDELTVRLDTGERVAIALRQYSSLKLGFAITTHKGQGITVEKNAYILAGGMMQDLHLSYVQSSRAKDETRWYVDKASAGEELRDLVRAMERPRHKELAVALERKRGDAAR